MTVGEMMRRALGRYGRDRFGAEDEQFSRAHLLDIINREHRHLAAETYCYYQRQTLDVPVGVGGTSTIPLSCNVIDPDGFSCQFLQGSDWIDLEFVPEEELRGAYGPVEGAENENPWAFFLRLGSLVDQNRVVELFPGSSLAVASGFRYGAHIYPAALTDDDEGIALQPGEHDGFVDLIVRGLAELDLGAGGKGADARLAYWSGQADEYINRMRTIINRNRYGSDFRQIRYTGW